jgi:hypothetical protein
MAKRIFQGLVLFFAFYAFVFVPLGRKTALEHIRAIFGTPAAQEAASEVKGGVTRLVRRLQSEARESTEEADRLIEDEPRNKAAAEEASDSRPPAKPKLRSLSAESSSRDLNPGKTPPP